jgi:hypothetical protein
VNSAGVFGQLRLLLTVMLIFYQGYVARPAPFGCRELLLTLEERAR